MKSKEFDMPIRFMGRDMHVHITEYGSKGKQLLCLHGFGGDGRDFKNLASYLAGYHIIAIDWIGFGESSKPLSDADTYDAGYLSGFLETFIRTAVERSVLKNKFSVFAASMSGLMIGKIYSVIRKHIEKIIFLNPAGFDREVSMKFSMVMANPLLKREAFLKLITTDTFWNNFLGLKDNDKTQLWSKVGSGEFEVYLRCINSSMTMAGNVKPGHVHDKYDEISVPVLMIGSYRDTLITEQEYLRKASRYGWDVVIIHHYDHMIIADKSKEIAKAIKEFL